jgi:hypothetical protein
LAIADRLWHKSQVPIFIERFVLPVFVALVIALAVTNPMGLDIQQRVSGALGLICLAYFLGHTIHKQKSLPSPAPPVQLPPSSALELPATRPQLVIVKWGQIDEATFTARNKAPHIVQHGFFIRNIGLGEAAIGVRATLTVPIEVPDVWTSGEGSTPAIVIGKGEEVFVPLWRRLGGYLIGHVLSRFDLRHFLVQAYNGKFGNQEIPVTITYSSNGKDYVTTQSLIFSPEQRDIVGFGVPEQQLEQPAPIETRPSPSKGSLAPNLVLKNIHTGGLIFTEDEWRQFELPGKPLSNRLQAVWAELKNDSNKLRRVGPISGVKAELVVIRKSIEQKFSPLVWLDNEFNAVNFELADTRHVLLVANLEAPLSQTSAWVVPLNHRGRNDSGSGLRMDVSHWMEKENADVRLNLLDTTTGTVLQSFAGKYIWRQGHSGPIFSLKHH